MHIQVIAAICWMGFISSLSLAADVPLQVQAKVTCGENGEGERHADVESWIRGAMEKAGSPRARPCSGWIVLNSELQKLHSSNGFIVQGKVAGRDGLYVIDIDACAGFSLDQHVTLKPGERRVIKLTDDPAPDNVFIALQAPVSEKAHQRAEAMKANAKTFRLDLQYNGEQGKPFYRLVVSVPIVNRRRSSSFERIVQVKEDEAIRIIDHLARDGFLDRALASGKLEKLLQPCYLMTVRADDLHLAEVLGWRLPMIHRLDALRSVLPDLAIKDMDLLLGRLSGLRKTWEAENPPFVADVRREENAVQFSIENEALIINIKSKFGIDKATIRRQSPNWPKSILLRLQLSGLELLNVGNGELSVDWSVSSTGGNSSRVFLRNGGEETALNAESPYHTTVRIVGGNGKIPLQNGYFEVVVPAKLFARNPDEITLEWIDFYRN